MDADLQNLRTRAYAVAYLGLLAIFVLTLALIAILPEEIFGAPTSFVVFVVAVLVWFAILIIAVPRCPKCNMGYFSMIEIAKVPILVRSWVGEKCSRCGASLK